MKAYCYKGLGVTTPFRLSEAWGTMAPNRREVDKVAWSLLLTRWSTDGTSPWVTDSLLDGSHRCPPVCCETR